MNLHMIWRTLRGGAQRSQCVHRSPVRPRLESLEDRTLLSQTELLPSNRNENGIAQRIQYLTEPQIAVQISDRNGTAIFTAPQGWNATTAWGVLGGQGTFTSTSTASGLLVVQADFNGDGLADPVVVSSTSLIGSSSAVLLLTGDDGIGTRFKLFSAPSQGQYFFAAAGDFNGDSKLDLALLSRVAGQSSQVNVQVFLGQGEGNFFSEVNLKVGQGVMSATVGSFNGNASLSVGDRNGDGAADIVLTHVAPTGTTLDILLSGAEGAFQATQWWVPPGPYSLQIRGNQIVVSYSSTEPTPPVLPETPPIPADDAGGTEEADSETPVDPPSPVIEPPAEPAPIVVQTSVEGTGLAVEVAIDSKVLPVAGQNYDQTFWGQFITTREVLVNDGGDAPSATNTATDSHPTTAVQQGSTEGKPTTAGSATSAGTGVAKTQSGSAREGSLVDIFGEEHFGLLDKSADHVAWLDQNLALQVGAWQGAASSVPVARVGEQPDDAEVLLSQQGPRLESKPGSLLLGLDDDVIAPLLLVRAAGDSDEGAAAELSVLDVGQALLQAMIIVKMTPGGSGPDNRGVPGVVAPNDSLMRIAELVKDSSQFLTRLVRSFYQRYLGRDAENGEEQGWVQMLLGGEREESVLSSFLSTREFGQHADALIDAGTPDEKYLQSLYILVLDRTPSTGEVAAWLQSPEGLNRQQAALALVSSNEFRVQQIEDMFRDSLQREPGSEEAIHWAATPFGLRDIRQFFATHPEWFQQP